MGIMNKPERAQYLKDWRAANKEKVAENKRAYRAAHLEQIKESLRARRSDPDFMILERARCARYRARHLEKRRAISRDWSRRNKPKNCAQGTKRRAMKMRALPKWANLHAISDVYKKASVLEMHVDHIVPLIHPLVCGLHVENNLQLLTPLQNFQKNNRWPWVPA